MSDVCKRCKGRGRYQWSPLSPDGERLLIAARDCGCGAAPVVASTNPYRKGEECLVCLNTGLVLGYSESITNYVMLLFRCHHCHGHGRSVQLTENDLAALKMEQLSPAFIGPF